MKNYKNINYIHIFNYILLFLLKIISSKKLTSSLRCLQVNQFNNLTNGEKTIGNKDKCFKVSTNCCFINLTYNYGDYLLKHEYCNHLEGNSTKFEQFLYDLFNDDEMFYANFTAHNYETYTTIGRNLEKNLTDTLNCFIGPKSYEEYSTYVVNNCKEFVDGVCTGKKNNTQFNEFVSGFHKNYSNVYCNKKEEGQKCIIYNGTRANDKMVKPLMDELVEYLQADNPDETYVVPNDNPNVDINTEYDEEDGNSTFLDSWMRDDVVIKKCIERPVVQVSVICPDGHDNFKIFFIYYKFLFFILLLIFF